MKGLSLKNIIDITFFVVIIAFSVLVYSTYNRAQQVRNNRLIVNRTSNINNVLEKVLSSSIDIETGTRGFTITGDESYLEVYEKGQENLKEWIDSLKSMNETDTVQLMQLDTLQRLITSKEKISALTIKTRKELGMEKAAEIVKTGRGKEIMDSIRASIVNYQNNAVKLLSQNLSETEENVKARNRNFTMFAVIAFLVILFAYAKIRQNAKRLLLDKIIQENLMDELTMQNQQLNDFANMTSHNLRSPAANITSLVAAIEEESTIDDYKMIFSMLKKVAANLNESLNQLMEVLHIRKNKSVDRETLIFQDIFIKTTETLQGEILASKAAITSDFSNAENIIYSRIYMDSIFHNLISNALKYRSPDRIPKIHVYTESKNNHIYLHVSDNGLGIDLAKNGHKLFGMNQVFHKHPEAKGIGLFMTKAQIESMKGKITVSSEVNSGTTFIVMFGN